jgi:tripartite-type tricarboxylate transporter receptor subunit TctC
MMPARVLVRRCHAPALLILPIAALLAAAPVEAHDFPARPVRVVVPFPPGGSLDVVARLIADQLSKEWSQPVVIENHSGVNGGLGAEAVVRAVPDGHTLLFATSPVFTTNKLLLRNLAYDPDRDLRPVSLAAVAPNVLGVSAGLPVKDVRELIAYAKANPDRVSFASQGNGSTGQMSGALFNQLAGLDIKHVPYRGAAPAWNDVVAGHVSMMWDGIPSVLGQIRAGSVRALAVGSRQRSPALPDVPTAIEAGLADFESVSWYAVAAPGATPDPVVHKIADAVARAVRAPDVSRRIIEIGAIPAGGTPEELAATIKETTLHWKKVIDAAHIRID